MNRLRAYQQQLSDAVDAAWAGGVRNVAVVAPTGSGKTVLFAHKIAQHRGAALAIAHRQELVGQISMALAREGVRHQVLAPSDVARACAAAHLAETRRSFVDPGSRVAVAGVDTLIRMDPGTPLLQQIGLWVLDETHHLLADNKWGKAVQLLPNARGLGVTATPVRADGRGLGRHADGLLDCLILGPTMRDLIGEGYLSDYRVFAPASDIDLKSVAITATGDYSPPQLREARHRSTVTGDVVSHYLRLAAGKLAVVFDVDIESATETAAAFRAAGVPAEVVTSRTPDPLRREILRRFKRREVLSLVNVDLFGEGYDLPAIEVVSMARPTQSYALYAQQFGRALRPLEGKDRATIIDHVGNVLRHGLPDAAREWSLDRRERRSRSTPTDVVPLRSCMNPTCAAVYERTLAACPHCGHAHVPAQRSAPEFVDGDLLELDAAVLARLRGEVADPLRIPHGATPAIEGALRKAHAARHRARAGLREAIELWAGWQRDAGRPDGEIYRRFYFRFGVDMGTALTASASDAEGITERVLADLDRANIIRATTT